MDKRNQSLFILCLLFENLTLDACLFLCVLVPGGCCSGIRGDGGDPDREEPRPGGESQRAERNSH